MFFSNQISFLINFFSSYLLVTFMQASHFQTSNYPALDMTSGSDKLSLIYQ